MYRGHTGVINKRGGYSGEIYRNKRGHSDIGALVKALFRLLHEFERFMNQPSFFVDQLANL